MKNLLYVAYNEEKHGPFDEAVRISNDLGCVTWFHPTDLDPNNLPCPTDVIVQISGTERYYRGRLLAVRRFEELGQAFASREQNHRPQVWRDKDGGGSTLRSVLFINGLTEVDRPRELGDCRPPQNATYIPVAQGASQD